jgi:hypothetical protein
VDAAPSLGKIKDLGINDKRCKRNSHFHATRLGVPNMLMHMWLLGRQAPLRFYGLHHCINRVEDMMGGFGWQEYPNFFPVAFHRVSERFRAPVMENEDFIITAWPTKHFNVPTVGLRIENKVTGKVFAYSCDTEPTESLFELAKDADMLLHEAAGPPPGQVPPVCRGISRVGAESSTHSLPGVEWTYAAPISGRKSDPNHVRTRRVRVLIERQVCVTRPLVILCFFPALAFSPLPLSEAGLTVAQELEITRGGIISWISITSNIS